jgi:DNA/RNA-binding domain of Phe-tRNA-synthetase-like protein
MNIHVINNCRTIGLRAGIAAGSGVSMAPAPPELQEKLKRLVEQRAGQEFPPPPLKEGVRKLLKKGGFKASGRSKPASEYLAQSAREERFPFISNLVDCNNYLSLLTGLPVTLLDLQSTGEHLELRTGREGESYVFNSAGHVIDLRGLICLCREDGAPLGNPVKDSMEAKLKNETGSVIGVIYAPDTAVSDVELLAHAREFAELLQAYGGAREITAFTV